MEKVNVVLVKHPNYNGQFMFRAPDGTKLTAGQRVLCDTSRGPCEMGTCVTDSFELFDYQLSQLWNTKIEKLKPVVGMLKPIMFVHTRYDDEDR